MKINLTAKKRLFYDLLLKIGFYAFLPIFLNQIIHVLLSYNDFVIAKY